MKCNDQLDCHVQGWTLQYGAIIAHLDGDVKMPIIPEDKQSAINNQQTRKDLGLCLDLHKLLLGSGEDSRYLSGALLTPE